MKKMLLVLLLNTTLIMQANGIINLINDSDKGVNAKLIFYNTDDEKLLTPIDVKSRTPMKLDVLIPDKANVLLVLGSQTGTVHLNENINPSLSYTITKSANRDWTIKQNS